MPPGHSASRPSRAILSSGTEALAEKIDTFAKFPDEEGVLAPVWSSFRVAEIILNLGGGAVFP
jgi:hypothetical protein